MVGRYEMRTKQFEVIEDLLPKSMTGSQSGTQYSYISGHEVDLASLQDLVGVEVKCVFDSVITRVSTTSFAAVII